MADEWVPEEDPVEPVQLSLLDDEIADDMTWDEWVRSLPVELEAA